MLLKFLSRPATGRAIGAVPKPAYAFGRCTGREITEHSFEGIPPHKSFHHERIGCSSGQNFCIGGHGDVVGRHDDPGMPLVRPFKEGGVARPVAEGSCSPKLFGPDMEGIARRRAGTPIAIFDR